MLYLKWLYALFILAGMAYAAFVSLKEKEYGAFRLFAISGIAGFGVYGLLLGEVVPFNTLTLGIFFVLPLGILVLLFVPFDPVAAKIKVSPSPTFRHDERDIMFARARLIPGTERYRAYYREHPDKERLDKIWRERPGLLKKGAKFFDPVWFKAADSSFETVEHFHPFVDGRANSDVYSFDAQKIGAFIKDWLKRSGAHSVGFTRLQEYHLYSHIGRQEPYGAEIVKEHANAIAFTVEMRKEIVDHAPLAPTVLESADQYLRAGELAVKLATFIRKLGYSARAHIDGNYRVICPLVARDAGLGEIGRMGLLMTPRLGPRVRIGVVTTDLPLITSEYTPEKTMIDFCLTCKKCAENCPSKAISFDDRQWDHGVLRWKINPEACYGYWAAVGTDCARCIQVCPYSHPDNLMHALVRVGVRRNVLTRKLAIKMDDVVYGRKPKFRKIPERFDFSSSHYRPK